MKNWEQIEINNNQPIFKTIVAGIEVTIGFTENPNPNLKSALIDILTSCYGEKVKECMKAIS